MLPDDNKPKTNINIAEQERRFYNMIVHEIRTQVGIVSNLSEMLLDDRLAQSHDFYKKALKQTSDRIVQLSQDFLEVEQFKNNDIKLKVEQLNISNFMDVFVLPYVNMAANKGLFLKLEVEKSCPKLIHTDIARLGQILSNLIDNAIKYTEEGQIQIHVHYDANLPRPLMIDVIDSGIGIDFEDEEARAKIFKEYSRLDNALDQKGVGLGLWIIKNLANSMKSSIEIITDHPKNKEAGSCFRLCLPLSISNQFEEEIVKADLKKSKKPKNAVRVDLSMPLLLVEDNRINQHIIGSLLESARLDFDVASSLMEARHLVNLREYSLILLDLNLPDGRGEEFIDSNKPQNVVALTADIDAQRIDGLMEKGFKGIIEKPINAKDFVAQVFGFLG